jgi:hypothetical protein
MADAILRFMKRNEKLASVVLFLLSSGLVFTMFREAPLIDDPFDVIEICAEFGAALCGFIASIAIWKLNDDRDQDL